MTDRSNEPINVLARIVLLFVSIVCILIIAIAVTQLANIRY